MARINVDQKALSDPRFAVLAQALDLGHADHALGKMIRVWNECQERETYTLSEKVIGAIFGRPDAAEMLVLAELGSRNYSGGGKQVPAGLIRICGTKDRTDWLRERRKEGRKGGRKGGRPRKPLGVDKNARQETPPAPAPAPASGKELRASPTAGAGSFRTYATETWERARGARPAWGRPEAIALQNVFRDKFHSEEAKAREAWDRFLADSEYATGGHDPKRFAANPSRWIGQPPKRRKIDGQEKAVCQDCGLDDQPVLPTGLCKGCEEARAKRAMA